MDNLIAAYLVRSNMDFDRSRRRAEPESFGLRKSGLVPLLSAIAGVGVFAVLMDRIAG